MKPTRYYSNRQEKEVSNYLGMKQVSNSGATTFKKGDSMDKNILMECKTCTKSQKSFSIQKDWLFKNEEETLSMGRQFGMLAFNFGPNEKNYVVMDIQDFKTIYEAWKELNKE